jgi:iron complex transport system substrate-binding protein
VIVSIAITRIFQGKMMKRFRFYNSFFIAIACILLAAVIGCSRKQEHLEIPKRIISLAPSITETLFALGLGERVIGVTSYCTYPPQTKNIDKIGGYADANLEKIIALHPDLVVLSREHEKQRMYLNRFGVSTLEVDNSTCASVCSSFTLIGKRCGVTNMSDSLKRLFHERLTQAIGSRPVRPKVLFCVGRDSPGAGRIKSVFAAGSATFYNDLIEAAGGTNAFSDSVPAYPRLSPEGIMAIAPDIVIDVAPAMGNYNCESLVADWLSMSRIPAIKSRKVYCMAKDYATVPGPRMLLLLDDLRQIITDAGAIDTREGPL